MPTINNNILNQVGELMSSCTLCERNCRVNRMSEQIGYCGLGKEAYLFKDFIHWGEEGDLSPSHTIYLSGCNMRCRYCDNNKYINNPCSAYLANPANLAKRIKECRKKNTKNINWVGGEPTVNLLTIVDILLRVQEEIQVVWNSNMFATPQAMKIIDSFTDIYLADFKFGNDKCAQEIADVNNYLNIVTRNLKMIEKTKRIIIRHLPLPGHIECCSKPLIKWLAANMPEVELSLTANLFPTEYYAHGVPVAEFQKLLEFQRAYGLKDVPAAVFPDEVKHDTNEIMMETNIIIKPDGSILFQDLNGNLANFAKDISEH